MSEIKLTIPNFIQASSPNGLRRLMLKTNARLGYAIQYFDIQNVRDEKNRLQWVAWFYEPIKNDLDIQQLGSDEVES